MHGNLKFARTYAICTCEKSQVNLEKERKVYGPASEPMGDG